MTNDTIIKTIEIINLVSLLGSFLINNKKMILGSKLSYCIRNLNKELSGMKAGNAFQDPGRFIRMRAALESCRDFLQIIYDMNYYDTSFIIRKIENVRSEYNYSGT